uniref:Uncharacterized protein n=1 Tax=Ditylenchus dipsaci TaxID=166011 RepID=A0A915DD53_9BILA
MECLCLEEGSSVLAFIHDIQKQIHPQRVLRQKKGDPLFDYTVNLNNLMKIIYISAEVRPDSLHKDSMEKTE